MRPSLILSVAIATFSTVIAGQIHTSRKGIPRPINDHQFRIPRFTVTAPSGCFATWHSNFHLVYFNLSIFDAREEGKSIEKDSIDCSMTFTLGEEPDEFSATKCNKGFAFWFTNFTSPTDFSISVRHTFEDKGTDTATTYYSFNNIVNQVTTDGKIFFQRALHGAEALRSEIARYDELKEPIILPITVQTEQSLSLVQSDEDWVFED